MVKKFDTLSPCVKLILSLFHSNVTFFFILFYFFNQVENQNDLQKRKLRFWTKLNT